MDLDTLRGLAPADQQMLLLGRIVHETTRMDAALRFLHAALSGHTSTDGYLDAPDSFHMNAKACSSLVATHETLEPHTRAAFESSIEAGRAAYKQRNRYAHDLLRASMVGDGWDRVPLSRQRHASPVVVDAEGMIALVCDIVAATWRLRGAAMHTLGRGWSGLALGAVEGDWKGDATYVR